MRNSQRGIRILIVAFVLGMAALLLPGPGSANDPMSHEEWIVTADAVEQGSAGRCPDGEICKELCEVWNNGSGTVVQTGHFDCFPE